HLSNIIGKPQTSKSKYEENDVLAFGLLAIAIFIGKSTDEFSTEFMNYIHTYKELEWKKPLSYVNSSSSSSSSSFSSTNTSSSTDLQSPSNLDVFSIPDW